MEQITKWFAFIQTVKWSSEIHYTHIHIIRALFIYVIHNIFPYSNKIWIKNNE